MSCGTFLLSWSIAGFLGGLIGLIGTWIGFKRMHRHYEGEHSSRTLVWMTVFGYPAFFVGILIFVLAIFSSRAHYESEINRQAEEVLQRAENLRIRVRNLRKATRIEVNAALFALAYEEIDPEQPMRVIIAFAHAFKITQERDEEERKEDLKEDKIIMGHTPEHGDIAISHREEESYVEGDLQKGKKARVGQFRVWRCRSNLIAFHHFWATNESTRRHDEERVRALYIQFNPETLEPECFAGTKEELWFHFFGHKVYRVTLEALWGKADPTIGIVDCRIR